MFSYQVYSNLEIISDNLTITHVVWIQRCLHNLQMANAENTGPELVEIAEDHKDKAVKMPSVATVAEVAVKNENGE